MGNELKTICDLLADEYGSDNHPKFTVLKAETEGDGKWTLVVQRVSKEQEEGE